MLKDIYQIFAATGHWMKRWGIDSKLELTHVVIYWLTGFYILLRLSCVKHAHFKTVQLKRIIFVGSLVLQISFQGHQWIIVLLEHIRALADLTDYDPSLEQPHFSLSAALWLFTVKCCKEYRSVIKSSTSSSWRCLLKRGLRVFSLFYAILEFWLAVIRKIYGKVWFRGEFPTHIGWEILPYGSTLPLPWGIVTRLDIQLRVTPIFCCDDIFA